MSGVGAIVWKEWREVLLPNGRPGKQLLGLLIAPLLTPLLMGFIFGGDLEALELAFATSVGAVAGMLPVFTVMAFVIDSFAGERERHTLETLLATELTASQVLTGKLLGLMTMAALFGVVGLAIVGLVAPFFLGFTPFYGLALIVGGISVVASLHGAAVLALIGVIISMRVKTVRMGQQVFAYVGVVPLILLTVAVPTLIGGVIEAPPALLAWWPIWLAIALVLTYAFVGLLVWIAARSFRREVLLAR